MTVDVGGISAEQKECGVRINMVPRDGGNTFRTYFYGAFTGGGMQGDNFTQDLRDRGLGTPDSVKKFWVINPAFGGPIKRDKIWFHTAFRHTGAWNCVAMFFNRNAGNPNAWTYEPDRSRPAAAESTLANGDARIAWQATPKHKLGVGFTAVYECACPRTLTAQFSAGVQRELVPRVSMDLSYFRTWFGNFAVTDSRAVGAADYDPFTITAPTDPGLPCGGGYVISDLYDLKPTAFGRPADNFITLASEYGKQTRHWNGVDLTLHARLRPGLSVQGGTSTGRTSTDNCDVVAKVADPPSQLYCHVDTKFLTQVKFVGTYLIPRVEVQLTGTLQSLPGPEIQANFNAPNALVAPSLGRNLAGGARNVTVNLVEPGTMYGERMNQIDVRVTRAVRTGGARVTLGLDLYNLLNTSAVLRVSNAYATWQRPEAILNARFAKVLAQIEF